AGVGGPHRHPHRADRAVHRGRVPALGPSARRGRGLPDRRRLAQPGAVQDDPGRAGSHSSPPGRRARPRPGRQGGGRVCRARLGARVRLARQRARGNRRGRPAHPRQLHARRRRRNGWGCPMSDRRLRWLPRTCLALAVLASACASRGGSGAASDLGGAMPADTDERLRWALADVRAPDRLAALGALEDSLRDFDARLARLVADSAMQPVVRANAVLLLGERRATHHLLAFWIALESPDVRVRGATAVALRGIINADERAGLRLARRALRDPEASVQARALEALADTDVDLLREYLASGPAPDVAKVATDLVRIAEERGAPLARAAAGDGVGPSGPHVGAKAAGGDDGAALVLDRKSNV